MRRDFALSRAADPARQRAIRLPKRNGIFEACKRIKAAQRSRHGGWTTGPSALDNKNSREMHCGEPPAHVSKNEFPRWRRARRRAIQKNSAGNTKNAMNIAERTLDRQTWCCRRHTVARTQFETGQLRAICSKRGSADLKREYEALKHQRICESADENLPSDLMRKLRHSAMPIPDRQNRRVLELRQLLFSIVAAGRGEVWPGDRLGNNMEAAMLLINALLPEDRACP